MNGIPDGPYSVLHLYIHIPFCRYRCDYCDFFSRVGVTAQRQEEIIDHTVRQGNALLDRDTSLIETVYVGGGTPSAISPPAGRTLLRFIESFYTTRCRTAAPKEVTVEVNPEDVTRALLGDLRRAGVNRLSVGIQSFDPQTLKTIGRHTQIEDTLRGIELIAEHWDSRWSGDLIVGSPGTDETGTHADLTTLVDYGPSHVSIYELGIEVHTLLGHRVKRGRLRPLPDEDVVRRLVIADTVLSDAGFRRYEVSNYARTGAESVHNLGYWRMRSNLGIGPGSMGTIVTTRDGDDPRRRSWIRTTTPRSFSAFSREDFGLEMERVGPMDRLKELCMMGLRTIEGISIDRFEAIAGAPVATVLSSTISTWHDAFEWLPSSPIETDSSSPSPYGENAAFLRIAPSRWMILDRILVDLFDELDDYGNSSLIDT